MINILLSIILLPFAALSVVFTVAIVGGGIKGIYQSIFKGKEV